MEDACYLTHSRRPSLYAAVRLARMVQQVRQRLRERISCSAQKKMLCLSEVIPDLPSAPKHQHTTEAHIRCGSSPSAQRRLPGPSRQQHRANFTGLLQDIEQHVSSPQLPLSAVAAQDHLFLQQRPADLRLKSIQDASHILDICTLLIDRLQHARIDEVKQAERIACEKYFANLEHLLRCFQQAALEALIHHSLHHLQNDYQYWDQYLEQRRKIDGDCSSEWVGGRPPLNSTMPWNIKPSLVILWGVCWMFYDNINPNRVSPEEARLRRESESWQQPQQPQQQQPLPPQWSQGYAYQTQSPTRRQSTQARHSLSAAQTPVSMGVGLGLHVTTDSPYDTRPTSEATMTHGLFQQGDNSHASSLLQQSSQQAAGGPFATPSKAVSYIRSANITPVSTSDTSLAVSSPAWSQDQASTAPYPTTHHAWGPHALSGPSSTPFGYQQPATPVSSHVGHFDIPSTAGAATQSFHRGGFTTPGPYGAPYFGGIHLSMHEQQPYPSPHSEGTREASVLPVTQLSSMSPPLQQHQSSPSNSYSPGPRSSISGASREPPRNEFGQITCEHDECLANPPTFTRKCEWSKHMDKHTRPYVCLQPGCEKIRGFTYSGGLLRHEREVHRKYGGPKAPRFCPHKDCKRSSGQGFSRKENLHEHLRRVHRGVGIEESDIADLEGPKPGPVPVASGSRGDLAAGEAEGSSKKRKRPQPGSADDDRDDNGPQTVAELREENKRLRMEVAQRDQRLKVLEDLMLRGMQPPMQPPMQPQI